jgi:hypothetical protein
MIFLLIKSDQWPKAVRFAKWPQANTGYSSTTYTVYMELQLFGQLLQRQNVNRKSLKPVVIMYN